MTLSVDGTHVLSHSPLVVTGGYVSTGIYSASFAFTGSDSLSTIYDVWFSGAAGISNADAASLQYYTGSIDTNTLYGFGYNYYRNYVLSMPNLQKEYYKDQTARLRLLLDKRTGIQQFTQKQPQ